MRSSRGPCSGVLLALLWGGPLASPLAAQFIPNLSGVIASPCRLDVVLVTFQDATSRQAGWRHNYHLHDLPHGYMRRVSDGALIPGSTSYKLEDFERLFGTDGAAAFTGTGQRVADNTEELPKVFGSVRAYFEAVSGGRFSLQVRIINPQDARGYPRWVQLPETKGYYADLPTRDPVTVDLNTDYWDDAYDAAQDSIALWYPGSTEYDLNLSQN